MGEVTGFLQWVRVTPKHRPVEERLKDWNEVYEDFPDDALTLQAGRCMDCGIPFCNNGCPLGNLIPDWNDLVYRGLEDAAQINNCLVARLAARCPKQLCQFLAVIN